MWHNRVLRTPYKKRVSEHNLKGWLGGSESPRCWGETPLGVKAQTGLGSGVAGGRLVLLALVGPSGD